MKKLLFAALAASALVTLPVMAAPQLMSSAMLDQVVAGTGELPPPALKGNNGWGNGADPTNAGSFSGGTAASKSTNASAAGKINTNPTTSNGR